MWYVVTFWEGLFSLSISPWIFIEVDVFINCSFLFRGIEVPELV